ncbi:helix-turn-helix domain-containing protein [Haloarcula litorea]|uniref:helix-turn-helix domain-containing protein n=1 Tax=Haloarcula litorea TaxID=3032579 RepID=UPI0023E84B47|nr:helix-turn-helix domain-containing protein [Halomicroarcula sp. GDY20]
MVTIVKGSVPAEEFALSRTLREFPGAEFEVERIVDSGSETVMPMLWVRDESPEEITPVLKDDPTVDKVDLVGNFDNESLYWMEWINKVQLVVQMLTNSEATILSAFGRGDAWQIRAMYPTRDLFSKTHRFVEDRDMQFDIEAIREMDGEPAGRYGLTVEQHEALVAAAKAGYYDVPRETSLEELAEEMDVSHQALSERLRRATEALVEDTILVGQLTD